MTESGPATDAVRFEQNWFYRVIVQRLMPVLALLAGIVLAVVLGRPFVRPEAAAESQTAAEFRDLPGAQQVTLLNRAEQFAELPEAEQQRMRELHQAVDGDPELKEKLAAFHAWWQQLRDTERRRLKPDGTFVADWVGEVDDVLIENVDVLLSEGKIIAELRFPFGGRRHADDEKWSFTEAAYQAFLEQAIPEDIPEDLAQDLEPFEDECEVTLVKTMWLLRNFSPRGRHVDAIHQAAEDHLIDSGLQQRREYREISWLPYRFTFKSMRSAFSHYNNCFQEKHLVVKPDTLLTVFETLETQRQLELMKIDPADARSELENHIIMNNPNPGAADLAQKLVRVSNLLRYLERKFDGRGRSGGPSSDYGRRSPPGGGRPDGPAPPDGGDGPRRFRDDRDDPRDEHERGRFDGPPRFRDGRDGPRDDRNGRRPPPRPND